MFEDLVNVIGADFKRKHLRRLHLPFKLWFFLYDGAEAMLAATVETQDPQRDSDGAAVALLNSQVVGAVLICITLYIYDTLKICRSFIRIAEPSTTCTGTIDVSIL